MELLKKEILEQAKLGFAVDIMEICKLYIAPKNSVRSLTPEAETITGFEARFSVNDDLKTTLESVSASVTSVVDSSPLISQIENLVDGTIDTTLKATFSARLTGKKLKVGGNESGIWFVPAAVDGSASTDETGWINVDESFVTKNTARTLEFYLPRSLGTGKKYFIAVRTSLSGSTELKVPVTGLSRIAVEIVE